MGQKGPHLEKIVGNLEIQYIPIPLLIELQEPQWPKHDILLDS